VVICFKTVFLHFFCGKNPKNTKLLVSNHEATTAGTKAFAQGNTVYSILFSLHNCIRLLPGSDKPGVPASDTNQTLLSDNKFR
jgi:hypothetical protein